jgi:hypothetical protein
LRRVSRKPIPGSYKNIVEVPNFAKLLAGTGIGRYLSLNGCGPKEEISMNKSRALCIGALLVALFAYGALAYSQEKSGAAESHMIIGVGDLKWSAIIRGCQLAPVSGDPGADGTEFVLRIRCVDGAKIPAHWHPTDENVTVLQGTFLAGMGEKFDESKLLTMNVGSFVLMPKEMRHFAMCKGETIVQVHGVGPFKVNWVNPAEVMPPDAAAGTTEKPKS